MRRMIALMLLCSCGGSDAEPGPNEDSASGDDTAIGTDSVVPPSDSDLPDTASDSPPPDGGPPSNTFFAKPEPAGSVAIKLARTEGITGEQLVTFGVPFARKSILLADVSKIRVLVAGAEVPAHVDVLTPWRHAVDAAEDGKYIRVSRVQLKTAATDLVVEWGGAARTKDVATLTRVRDGWHRANTGTFVTADNVDEPNVYALLPPARLAAGLIKAMPMTVFDAEVKEPRDPPATMKATEHYPLFREQMFASKNFFYTAIGEDDPLVTSANRCPYKNDSEPWLYDRSAAFFNVYLRSGFLKPLREAVRASVYYAGQLYPPGTMPDKAVGVFKLKTPSPSSYVGANGVMYSYGESLAYAYWLTGDDELSKPIAWASKAQEDSTDEPYKWSTTAGYTERHVGFRLLAHTVAYEVFGDVAYKPGGQTYKQLMITGTDNLIWHQDGGGGAVPTARIDGALWKYGRQQGDGPEDAWVASPWLSAIVVDAMVRVYGNTARTDVAHFIRRMGTFLKAASDLIADDEYDSGKMLRKVDYVTLIDGSTYAADGANGEHALEVAGSIASAYAFSKLVGMPDATLKKHAEELYETYDYSVNFWTRPTAPSSGLSAYRLTVGSCRKYGWEHRPSPSLAWALAD
jgi:hypothetical protein